MAYLVDRKQEDSPRKSKVTASAVTDAVSYLVNAKNNPDVFPKRILDFLDMVSQEILDWLPKSPLVNVVGDDTSNPDKDVYLSIADYRR